MSRDWAVRFGVLLGWGTLAWAQAPQGFSAQEMRRLLDTEIITASRISEPLREAPATVRVVTHEEIRARGYRSLFDLLQDLPGFKVERGVHEHYYTSFSTRGIAGSDQFILLVDGHRVTGPTNEPLPLFENMPVHMARRVEIVYGPASALYGADAVAAVINLITRDPQTAPNEGLMLAGDHSLGLTQWMWNHRGEGWALAFSGQLFVDQQPSLEKDYPDYRNFQAQRLGAFPTAFNVTLHPSAPFDSEPSHPLWAQAFQLGLEVDALHLGYFRNASRFPSFDKNTPDNAIYNSDLFIEHRLEVFSFDHRSAFGELSLSERGSLSRYELDPRSNYRDAFGYFDRAYKYARSSSLRLELQADWEPAPSFRGSLGYVHESDEALPWSADLAAPVDPHQDVQGTLLGAPITAHFYQLAFRNDGLFGQAQWKPQPELTLTLGSRVDWNSRYGHSINPRLGLNWSPNSDSSLRLLYGTAFLAPSPYQAYLHYGAFFTNDGGLTYQSFFWRLPNPDLKPQESRTLELGARHLFGAGVQMDFTCFAMRLKNLFAVVPDGTVADRYHGHFMGWPVQTILVVENLGEQRTWGSELDLRWPWTSGATLRASVSYVEGREDALGNGRRSELGQISPWTGRLGADLRWSAFSFSPRLVWVGTQRTAAADVNLRRYRLPGYALLTCTLQHEWQVAKGTLGLLLDVRNGLDERYRNLNYGAHPGVSPEFFGVPQDPRRWALGLRWTR